MCDLFWLSPDDQQGDLSDVVRASLQPPLQQHDGLPAPSIVCSPLHRGLPVPEEEEKQPLHGLLDPQPQQPEEGLIRLVMSAVRGDRSDEGLVDMAAATMPHHASPSSNSIIKQQRRRSQTKKVVCIPAPTAAPPGPGSGGEVVPSDLWAWRKYGQKPIKGSPYPRGYYRCSSSKGCSARKQVERSRTDPSMLVVTYTSDHNHPWPTQRNALAGSTRTPASSSSSSSSATSTIRRRRPQTTTIAAMLTKQELADGHDFPSVHVQQVQSASSNLHSRNNHLLPLPEEEDVDLCNQLLPPLDRDPFSFSFSFSDPTGWALHSEMDRDTAPN